MAAEQTEDAFSNVNNAAAGNMSTTNSVRPPVRFYTCPRSRGT